METYIPISQLNDFVFCPRSIYYHQLYNNYDTTLFYNRYQIDGKAAHQAVDEKRYSTRKEILQGLSIYSERFQLGGKIDIYNTKTQVLTERKKKVIQIYDGYIYQVYAQYYAMEEMGYPIKEIKIYSINDNKSYFIPLPEEDLPMRDRFLSTLEAMKNFSLNASFSVSSEKCQQCIYRELCDIPC